MSCVTVDVLTGILTGDISPSEQETAESHALSCARCAEKVAAARDLAAVPDAAPLLRAMQRDVEATVGALLEQPAHRWPLIARDVKYARGDVARRLLTLADEQWSINRRRAYDIAEVAAQTAQAATEAGDASAPLILADALKLCATLLYEAGRASLAFDALDRAELALADVPYAVSECARLQYCRAYILGGPDVWKPDEALALLEGCRRVWSETGNAEALRDAIELTAVIRQRSGDHAGALALLLPMLPTVSMKRRPALCRNVAVAALRLGDLAAAQRFTDEALSAHTAAGARMDVARDRWLRGCIAIESGRFAEALPDLEHARAVFHADGQEAELRVRVDVLVAILGMNPDADVAAECTALVNDSAHLDQRESSRLRSFTADAMAFLRDRAVRRELTTFDVAHVAAFLAQLAMSRPVPFSPPLPVM